MQSDDDDFTISPPQRIHFVHRKRGYFFKWREAVCPPIVKKGSSRNQLVGEIT
jgi:hypothetical protein